MTNSNRWTDDRLDRLATDVEQNTNSISELRLGLADLRSSAESLLQIAQLHQVDIEALGRDMQGLKLEVRRLVEELRESRGS